MPNVSLICTVLNEAESLPRLLNSIAGQSRLPNEAIFVDGGSTDSTVKLLKKAVKQFPHLHLKVYRHSSNRSGGRNYAIQKAKYDVVAITDAGCILDQDWLAELVKAQMSSGTDVVAGYYRAEPQTPFEEAMIPYVLVMPERVDPLSFLPATRSMLIKKTVFAKVGYFNDQLDVSEDYEFAHRLVHAHVPIVFAKAAQVVWEPRKNLTSFFKMVFSMAKGDVLGKVVRWKVWLVLCRYLVFSMLLVYGLFFDRRGSVVSASTLILYLLWAWRKNHQYVTSLKAAVWLLLFQIVADVGVVLGTISGFFDRLITLQKGSDDAS